MRSAIVLFPGTNRERDMAAALRATSGREPAIVWHGDTDLPDVDLIVLPGGFSFGDYLRSGAIAARSPIMAEVVRRAGEGVAVLGVCNGFQTLCEAGLLPGALMRNASLKFVCREVKALPSPIRRRRSRGATPPVRSSAARSPIMTAITSPNRKRCSSSKATDVWSSATPRGRTPTARSMTSPASSTPPATCLA